jgi:polygalacturonase
MCFAPVNKALILIERRDFIMEGKFRKTIIVLCGIFVFVLGIGASSVFAKDKSKSEVVLFGGPSGIKAATDRIITVNGKQLFVYDTPVNLNRAFEQNPKLSSTPMAYFDFSGKVDVKIKAPGKKLKSAVVRPLSLGIKPTISGDTIEFILDKPGNFTIELNNEIDRAVHIFANPIEANSPSKDDPNVIYFGPGVHKAGSIPVKSNQTVYIAGGAVVYGVIHAENMDNITVTGHGIIDGSIYDRWTDTMIPIDFRHCTNSKINGVIFLNPAGWTVNTYFCDNVKIDNIKIISARSNGDGITMQSCKNMTASNSFVRSWDDSLVVKDYDNGDTDNITFDNINIWTDLAQSCEIGYETRGNSIENVTFKNINILHNFHKPALSIHNGDNAAVKNIHYSNITVEDAAMGLGDGAGNNYLIDLWVGIGPWTQAKQRGTISNIYFDNINVLSGKDQPSRIKGDFDNGLVSNVFINNLTIKGKAIKNLKDGLFNVYSGTTKNIKLTYNNNVKPKTPRAQAKVDKSFIADTKFTTITPPKQDEPFVPAWAKSVIPSTNFGVNLAKGKDIVCNEYVDVYIAKNANDGDDKTYWEGASKKYPNQLTVDLAKEEAIKHIVIKLNPANLWGPRTETFTVLGSSDGTNFVPIVPSKDYQFDPATGNLVIIDLDSAKARYIRLEFTGNTGANAGQVAEFEVY